VCYITGPSTRSRRRERLLNSDEIRAAAATDDLDQLLSDPETEEDEEREPGQGIGKMK